MKRSYSEGPTFSVTTEGSRADMRQMGEQSVPLARSKAPARFDKSSARKSGGLQLTLPGIIPGEYVREPRMGASRTGRLEKSDSPIVPKKPANEALASERVEGRGLAKGKAVQVHPHRTRSRIIGGKTGLERLRERVRRWRGKKGRKYTNLFTHLRVDLLKESYERLKKRAAPGVDNETWAEYGEGLEERLTELQGKLHRGSYKPQPVRREYIPKPGGKQRPLGIPTVEDKVVQGAVMALLTPIYEAEFLDCSYGFRPNRKPHDALRAVDKMLYKGKVNWILDLDIKSYFDTINHEWLIKMLEHRIGDRRIIRLIRKWLKAGILEDGEYRRTEEGTPQGGLISPLLANIYLHYVLDVWFEREKKQLRGEAHLVRYADDVVIGFQYYKDARAMWRRIAERMRQFGLQLHAEKTHLLRFGRFAHEDCLARGQKKPETFEFLGFTHICGKSRKGKFVLLRRTSRKKSRAKKAELKKEMRKRMHWRIKEQWVWLSSVLRGHYNYYGLCGNYRPMASFRRWVQRMWHKILRRRSQRTRMTRARLKLLDQKFPLPRPRILRPYEQLQLALF